MTTPELKLSHLLAGQSAVTVSCAESCTGGSIASRITSIAGSSDYFPGGIVTYSNLAKFELLGVSQRILREQGAVSAECAAAMAAGALSMFHSTLALSTTGIAGPGGATARKPVGLVYIGLATPDGVDAREFHFEGDRAAITSAASEAALNLLLSQTEQWLTD